MIGALLRPLQLLLQLAPPCGVLGPGELAHQPLGVIARALGRRDLVYNNTPRSCGQCIQIIYCNYYLDIYVCVYTHVRIHVYTHMGLGSCGRYVFAHCMYKYVDFHWENRHCSHLPGKPLMIQLLARSAVARCKTLSLSLSLFSSIQFLYTVWRGGSLMGKLTSS